MEEDVCARSRSARDRMQRRLYANADRGGFDRPGPRRCCTRRKGYVTVRRAFVYARELARIIPKRAEAREEASWRAIGPIGCV